MVFLEPFRKYLLFFHLVSTGVLLGALTHGLIVIVGYYRGKFAKRRLEKLYLKVGFWAYLCVFTFGALVYPTFRIRVRYEYFDETLPWATGLFEVREHWASIGLALFIALLLFRKHFNPEQDRPKLFLYTALFSLIYLIVWYCTIFGYYLTTLRSV